jgi:hypothetical protein
MPRTHTQKQQLAFYAEARRRSHRRELLTLKRENDIMKMILEAIARVRAKSNGHTPLPDASPFKRCPVNGCGIVIGRTSKTCMMHRPQQMISRFVPILLLLLSSVASLAQSYTFAWDPSPSSTNQIIGYRLYASTNSLTYPARLTAPIRLDAGTNTMAQVTNALNGTYWFYATAYNTNGIESVLSDPLVVTVPVYAPQNLRTVFLQWNATVTGTNWIDTGFFRIKFGP